MSVVLRLARRCLAAFVVALALLPASPAGAQEPCASAVTQADLNACSLEEWRLADEELNQAYAAAVAYAREFDAGGDEGQAEEALRAAQRAWVAFRDAACEAEAAVWDEGSAQPMIRNGCLATLTAERTDWLWAYAGQ